LSRHVGDGFVEYFDDHARRQCCAGWNVARKDDDVEVWGFGHDVQSAVYQVDGAVPGLFAQAVHEFYRCDVYAEGIEGFAFIP